MEPTKQDGLLEQAMMADTSGRKYLGDMAVVETLLRGFVGDLFTLLGKVEGDVSEVGDDISTLVYDSAMDLSGYNEQYASVPNWNKTGQLTKELKNRFDIPPPDTLYHPKAESHRCVMWVLIDLVQKVGKELFPLIAKGLSEAEIDEALVVILRPYLHALLGLPEVKGEKILFAKAHVKGYVNKHGTWVKEHDDKRPAAKKQEPELDEYGLPILPAFWDDTPKPTPKPKPQYKPGPKEAPKAFHPKPGDKGEKIGIYKPSTPTPESTWTDPKAIATWVPGGKVPDELNGIPFAPWDDHPEGGDWGMVDGTDYDMDEPDFKLTPGKAESAGCIIREPDGRVWVISPTNKFGGYTNTFPKGRVEDGLEGQETAIKEVYEESGLKVRITGVLGDFERTTTTTRFYLAERVGGSPNDPTWETQAVHLVPLQKLEDFAYAPADQKVVEALLKLT